MNERFDPLWFLFGQNLAPCGLLGITKGVTPLQGNEKLLLYERAIAEEGKGEVAG